MEMGQPIPPVHPGALLVIHRCASVHFAEQEGSECAVASYSFAGTWYTLHAHLNILVRHQLGPAPSATSLRLTSSVTTHIHSATAKAHFVLKHAYAYSSMEPAATNKHPFPPVGICPY
jgi:hypothetical protein